MVGVMLRDMQEVYLIVAYCWLLVVVVIILLRIVVLNTPPTG